LLARRNYAQQSAASTIAPQVLRQRLDRISNCPPNCSLPRVRQPARRLQITLSVPVISRLRLGVYGYGQDADQRFKSVMSSLELPPSGLLKRWVVLCGCRVSVRAAQRRCRDVDRFRHIDTTSTCYCGQRSRGHDCERPLAQLRFSKNPRGKNGRWFSALGSAVWTHTRLRIGMPHGKNLAFALPPHQ
jgi:hypothetical protein